MREGEAPARTSMSQEPQPAARRSWRAAFDRVIALLLGAVTIGNALVAVLSAAVHSPSARVAAVVVLVAANVAALLTATRRGSDAPGRRTPAPRRRTPAALVQLAVAGLTITGLVLAARSAAAAGVPVNGWWPFGLASITAVLLAVRSRLGRGLALVLLATYTACRAQVPATGGSGQAALVEGVSFANALITITVMVLVIRRGADRADASAARLREAEGGLTAQRAAERKHDEIDRWVHDEVMHALRAVRLAGRGLAPAEVRRVLGALAWEPVDTAERDERGVDLREILPPRWQGLDVDATVAPVVVPGRVAQALTGAVNEALRNVLRHAGVTTARLTVLPNRDGGVEVEVADAGRGLRGAGPGRGIRASITARMAEVGGSARVTSGPRGGTAVRLEWHPAAEPAPARPTDPAEPRLDTILGWLRTGFVLAAAPSLVASVVFALTLHDEMARPALNLASLGLLLIVAAMTTWSLLRGRYGTVAIVLTLLVGGVVALGNAAAMPRPADNGFLYWAAGGVNPLIIVVLVFGRRPVAVVGAAALVLVVAGGAVASTGGGELGPMLPAALTPVNAFVPALLARVAIDRLAGSLHADADALREAERLRRDSLARSATVDQRLRELALVRDFLRQAADRLDRPPDEDLLREAAELEAALRDRLDAGRVPPPALVEAAARLRSRGWWVTVRWGEAGTDPALGALLAQLAEALDGCPAPSGGRLTVSPSGASGGGAVAVLSPGADGSWRAPEGVRRLSGPDGPLIVAAAS